MSDQTWDELGKVDYFLDHLGRAVDRGDLSYDAYTGISAPYWERRTELVSILQRRSVPMAQAPGSVEVAAAAAMPTPEAAPQAAPAVVAAPAAAPPEAVPVPAAPAPLPAPPLAVVAPARVRESISPGTWMAYAGALLVVIAVAIFTIYAWGSFPPLAKLGVLLAVTAAFYAGGEFIRTKLELPAVGVALVSVGSAMLLFDGWMVIRSTNAAGPLPWAILLLMCSLAYWATEVRISGGWFGAIGAAAQVGWWWLLGQAFKWDDHWVAAGVAVIAMLWELASERGSREGPLGPLRRVLGAGSILLGIATTLAVAVAAVAAQFDKPSMLPAAAAALTAACVMVVMERLRIGPLSVIGQAPLFVAALAYWAAVAIQRTDPSWWLATTLLLMTVTYAVRCLWRRSAAFALAALGSELLFWLVLADIYGWSARFTVGVVAGLGLATVAAGRLAAIADRGGSRLQGAGLASVAWRWGGAAVLLAASALVPSLDAGDALFGARAGAAGQSALLAAWVLTAWLATARVGRSAWPGRAGILWSFYALAAAVAWAAPDLGVAWTGCALLGLAVLWEHIGEGAELLSLVSASEVRRWALAAYVVVPLGAFVAASDPRSYAVAALLGAAALAWLLDALAARFWWSCIPASVAMVSAAGMAAWTWRGADEGTASASAVAALVAVTWFAAARFSEGVIGRHPAWRGTGPSAREWAGAGTIALALATLLVPTIDGVPLTGAGITGLTVSLAAWVLVAWLGGATLWMSAGLGRIGMAWSFFAMGALLAWAAPTWLSAYYGLAMLALAAAWSQGAVLSERVVRVSSKEIRIWMRVAYLVIPLLAALGAAVWDDVRSYSVAVLFAGVAAAWLLDGLRTRAWWVLAIASASLVLAGVVTGWTARDLPAAAIAAAAAALAPALASLLSPRSKRSWGAFASTGGTVFASACAILAWQAAGELAAALLVLALAWVLCAWCSTMTELGGVAATAAVLALMAALSHWDRPAWVTVVSLAVSAALLLAPRFLLDAEGAGAKRLIRILPGVGAAALAYLCAIGFASWMAGPSFPLVRWASLGATGFSVALMLAGGYAIAWTTLESFEPGLYAGVAITLLGVFVQMDGWGIDQAEPYLALAATYFAGMGWWWSRRRVERKPPLGTDYAAFAVGVAAPAMLALTSLGDRIALEHGLWTLGLAFASIMLGVLLRTKVYFFGGVVVLVLDALWLSRSVLFALPSWVWIGTVGLVLIAAGVTYARRESLEHVGRTVRARFVGWR